MHGDRPSDGPGDRPDGGPGDRTGGKAGGKADGRPGDALFEQLLADYQQQRSGLADLHRRALAVSATAASPRRELSVTVSHSGGLTDLAFHGHAYRRLPPQELAALVLRTVQAAREQAAAEVADLVAPLLPGGLDAREAVTGRLDFAWLAPEDGPRLPQAVREGLRPEGLRPEQSAGDGGQAP